MAMHSRQSFPFLPPEGLRLISYCPLCNTHYNPLSAQILEEREDAHLIHTECRKCGSSILALVFTGAVGISSVNLVTDLTGSEVLKFRKAEVVQTDDVLDVHCALQDAGRNILLDITR